VKRNGRGEGKITHFFKGIGISLGKLQPIMRCRGAHRRISIFLHPELGKVFVLGSEIQHVEAWAPLYHEPLIHLPASFVPKVKDVLILGGGTLYAASEALKYRSVERVVVVDRDPLVARTVGRYYSHAKKCFADPRFSLVRGDAYTSLSRLRCKFDLVINDGADLLEVIRGPSSLTRRTDCFSAMKLALHSGGVCADVVYRHVFERSRTTRTLKLLAPRGNVALSLVFLPEYHGVLHMLLMWGRASSRVSQNANQPTNREQNRWLETPSLSPCEYYDPRFLAYYFYLPRYIREAIGLRRKVV
jgi:spermidine synthase